MANFFEMSKVQLIDDNRCVVPHFRNAKNNIENFQKKKKKK